MAKAAAAPLAKIRVSVLSDNGARHEIVFSSAAKLANKLSQLTKEGYELVAQPASRSIPVKSEKPATQRHELIEELEEHLRKVGQMQRSLLERVELLIGEFRTPLVETAHEGPLSGWDPYEEGRKIVAGLKQAEGGALDREKAAERLDLTVQALHQRRERGEVVAWEDAAGRFRFPKWQFGANGLIPGIVECLAELRGSDDWAVMRFFLFGSKSFGGKRPLDLLRDGRVDEAVELARSQSVAANV